MRELEAVRMANSELHLDVLRRRRTGVMLMLKLSSAEEDSRWEFSRNDETLVSKLR